MTDDAITTLAPLVGTRAACAALGEARARYYRRHRKSPAPERPVPVRTPQPRALSEPERAAVLEVLHHSDHIDEAPATVYAKLLDEGTYLASTSTMYRLLRGNAEVRERRRQATHPDLLISAGCSKGPGRLLGRVKRFEAELSQKGYQLVALGESQAAPRKARVGRNFRDHIGRDLEVLLFLSVLKLDLRHQQTGQVSREHIDSEWRHAVASFGQSRSRKL